MRIISQNGRINVCYERVHILIVTRLKAERTEYVIRAIDYIKNNMGADLAIYSSLEKAETVFEDLYLSLKGNIAVCILPTDDKVVLDG